MLLQTYKKIFWRTLVTKQFWFQLPSTVWTQNKTKQLKLMGPETVCLPTFFKTYFFMLQRRNIVMFGNDMKANFFSFWVDYYIKLQNECKNTIQFHKKWYT